MVKTAIAERTRNQIWQPSKAVHPYPRPCPPLLGSKEPFAALVRYRTNHLPLLFIAPDIADRYPPATCAINSATSAATLCCMPAKKSAG